MPLFEYNCKTCGHHFEALVFGNRQPMCPKCQGRELDKQPSRFATTGSKSGSPLSGMGGACAPSGGG